MTLRISGISSDECMGFWSGGVDSNGQPALIRVAEGLANPCRHCLRLIPSGEKKLVLAYRPFSGLHPYAETGPIFLHAEPCESYRAETVPSWFDFLDPAIVRGYGHDDWIRYETGSVVRGTEIKTTCEKILADPEVAYVHVRSKFNCFQCRVDRA